MSDKEEPETELQGPMVGAQLPNRQLVPILGPCHRAAIPPWISSVNPYSSAAED